MRHLFILSSILLLFFSCKSNGFKYKEGDVVFQISKSRQSPLIQYATFSPWSHCGIVVKKNGKWYVLEASNVVKLTPLKTWEERGRFGAVKAYRVTEKDIKIKYKDYLGMPYDLAFKFNNGKMYCSELVYEIYKKQFNIEICKPKKLKEYNTLGIKDVVKNRGMSSNQLVVAPSDLIPGMKEID